MFKLRKRVFSMALAICMCIVAAFSNPLAVAAETWEENYNSGHLYYTSAALVNGLNGNVTSITPPIDNSKIPYGTASFYLGLNGPLTGYGPLGPWGPLGLLGPVGTNLWNPSYWISGWMDWSDWSDGIEGPLGPGDPLGENGPLGSAYYDSPIFDTNDFAVQTRALGLWTSLGPISQLGALGPLGPLGPVGAHGYRRNSSGQYIAGSNVARNVTMWFDEAKTTQRTYELYENYTESFAKSMADNDTSFMVEGTATAFDRTDTYTFTSNQDQLVTILVANSNVADTLLTNNFDLTITDEHGNPLITSNLSGTWADWIQMKVPANTTLKAEVKLATSFPVVLPCSYRLFVTGSTQYVNKTEITGDHIRAWK